jgi:cell division protein FtsB
VWVVAWVLLGFSRFAKTQRLKAPSMTLPMRVLIVALLMLLVGVQYRLWYGAGGVLERRTLNERLVTLYTQTAELEKSNAQLRENLPDSSPNSTSTLSKIEKYAREDMGLIKAGEVFYWIVEEK